MLTSQQSNWPGSPGCSPSPVFPVLNRHASALTAIVSAGWFSLLIPCLPWCWKWKTRQACPLSSYCLNSHWPKCLQIYFCLLVCFSFLTLYVKMLETNGIGYHVFIFNKCLWNAVIITKHNCMVKSYYKRSSTQ